ncbi:hypothetical protein V2A60_006519 [Cordyceps javanica]|uniref:WW/Rsp5/WWP n=1 Tax=Cordyceps javanica TaxID=43265 RepID=A0A545W4Z7_9HYPO|nr:WW/Rsp5/WWP [Cordyceps javanica]TQW09069.1 WW/Rsp5/WWP [Cordyceps javanica]
MATYQDNLAQNFGNMGLGPNNGQYPPPQQGYGYQGQPSPSQYSSPPPQDQYGSPAPPPPYQPPQDKPPIPREWRPFYCQQHQRWYYANENTSETQWEAPGYYAPSQPAGDNRGYNAPPGAPPQQQQYQQYSAPPGPPPGNTKSSGGGGMGMAGGMAMGAVAGLAAGAAGHYLFDKAEDAVEHKVDDVEGRLHRLEDRVEDRVEDREDRYEARVDRDEARWEEAHYAPAILPARDADGDSVSSSDREEVEEARARYEEALRDAASSSASSSDREELEEAREEYEEVYEETYGGDDYDDDY